MVVPIWERHGVDTRLDVNKDEFRRNLGEVSLGAYHKRVESFTVNRLALRNSHCSISAAMISA